MKLSTPRGLLAEGGYKRDRDRFCPECGRRPFCAHGLRGHLNFYHGGRGARLGSSSAP